jgi:hypothetical protein
MFFFVLFFNAWKLYKAVTFPRIACDWDGWKKRKNHMGWTPRDGLKQVQQMGIARLSVLTRSVLAYGACVIAPPSYG